MSKTLLLTIDEIRATIPLLREFKGDAYELAIALEDVKKFVITEDDLVAAKLVKSPTDEELKAQVDALPEESRKDFKAEQKLTWDSTWTKSIEVNEVITSYLSSKIKEKNDAKSLTLADQAIISLQAKLK